MYRQGQPKWLGGGSVRKRSSSSRGLSGAKDGQRGTAWGEGVRVRVAERDRMRGSSTRGEG